MRYQTYTSGVYAIYDLNKNCIYVGATKNFDARYKQHVKMLFDGNHHNKELQDYCNKIGVETLVFTPIFFCQELEIMFYEKKFIDLLKPYANGVKLLPIEKPDFMLYSEEYKMVIEKYLGKWVSAAQLSSDFGVSLKRAGMICRGFGFKSKKDRQKENRTYFYVL